MKKTLSNPVRGTTHSSCKTQENADAEMSREHRQGHRHDRLSALLVVAFLLFIAAAIAFGGPEPANAATPWRGPVTATWYGPGFYGNTFACAGKRAPDGTRLPRTYAYTTRGIAHRTLPCGTRLRIKRYGRIRKVRVIDRGPYSAATFDLTARTAMDLCACSKPYTMQVQYLLGWGT
jgi:rare lipoprotein A (peptidoglycan hydrolase)